MTIHFRLGEVGAVDSVLKWLSVLSFKLEPWGSGLLPADHSAAGVPSRERSCCLHLEFEAVSSPAAPTGCVLRAGTGCQGTSIFGSLRVERIRSRLGTGQSKCDHPPTAPEGEVMEEKIQSPDTRLFISNHLLMTVGLVLWSGVQHVSSCIYCQN